ncbi:type II secretion system F family protein [Microvirga sp. BSC39]|uniref:type II secretion system F family protein n=1 Tax=Microvirga sp. BSC39 TaxID=1549810 RepID=UPI0004E9541E|nr:type II secretion system F family protein [Microvirga sp. BSC39]KFG70788.1 type II secretion system protein [Microvirga sp. BSC39]
MYISTFITNTDILIPFLAALSAFSAALLVAWPYLAKDQLSARMAQVHLEREGIRVRERNRLNRQPSTLRLDQEPRRIFASIVEKFSLLKETESGELVRTLRMAGYRGRGPIVTFLAARVLMPVVMLVLATFYIFVVLDLQHPLIVKLALILAAAWLGYYAPLLYLKNMITKRQLAIRRAWPDTLDLLLICIECGMGIETAFRKVSEEVGSQCPELAEEISLTTAELSYLQDRRKAYENLGERTGLDCVRSVVTSLIQSEKYGTPLSQSLRVLAQENRDMRMSEAEKKAASLPPKLTVPMIVFFLPVLFGVILTPAIIQITTMN